MSREVMGRAEGETPRSEGSYLVKIIHLVTLSAMPFPQWDISFGFDSGLSIAIEA